MYHEIHYWKRGTFACPCCRSNLWSASKELWIAPDNNRQMVCAMELHYKCLSYVAGRNAHWRRWNFYKWLSCGPGERVNDCINVAVIFAARMNLTVELIKSLMMTEWFSETAITAPSSRFYSKFADCRKLFCPSNKNSSLFTDDNCSVLWDDSRLYCKLWNNLCNLFIVDFAQSSFKHLVWKISKLITFLDIFRCHAKISKGSSRLEPKLLAHTLIHSGNKILMETQTLHHIWCEYTRLFKATKCAMNILAALKTKKNY